MIARLVARIRGAFAPIDPGRRSWGQSAERFRLITEGLPIGVMILDALGRVRIISTGARAMLGLGPDQGFHQPLLDRLVEADRPADLDGLVQRLADSPVLHLDCGSAVAPEDRTGTGIPVHAALVRYPVRNRWNWMFSFIDLRPPHAAAARIAESERRFEAIFESQQSFTGLLAPDGTILELNRAGLDFLGRDRADVVGRFFPDGAPWGAGPTSRARLREAIDQAAQGRPARLELDVRGAGGRLTTIDLSIRPIHDAEGRVVLLVPEAWDIGDRRRMELQARATQRMLAIGQLTGGVAHEFNNLLQVVTGQAELIAGSGASPDVVEGATQIQRAAARGAALTQHLLAFSRRQALDPVVLSVAEVLKEAATLSGAPLGDRIWVRTAIDCPAATVRADRTRLHAALLHLLLNARDALPEGGPVTLACADCRLDPAEAAALDVAPGAFVRIDVIDEGTGMTGTVRERAFEPFFTTRGLGRGTGLGLSTVHGFARQSGGAASIRSTPGAGTTVSLYLPVATDNPALPAGGRRILVVEDDPGVLEVASLVLRGAGFEVLGAADGPSALALVEAGAQVDVLFTDVVMPGGLSGPELAFQVEQRHPHLVVIFTSGYNDEIASLDGALAHGATLLRKPYRVSDLLAALEEAVAVGRTRHEAAL